MSYNYNGGSSGGVGAGKQGSGGSGDWMQALSALGPGIGSMFGAMNSGHQQPLDWSHMQNPANSAMPYLNQIGGTMMPFYSPYINAGKNALGSLQNAGNSYQNFALGNMPGLQSQYNSLMSGLPNLHNQYSTAMNDPSAITNRIGASFKQSPGYKFQTDQAQQAVNRAAAAGGMLGSQQQQQNSAGVVNDLANQDYNNYMNRGLGVYNQGLQGAQGLYNRGLSGLENMTQFSGGMGTDIGKHLSNLGYNASSGMADSLANALMSQAQLAYQGQQGQNQMQMSQDMWNQQQQGSQNSQWGDAFSKLFGGAMSAAGTILPMVV